MKKVFKTKRGISFILAAFLLLNLLVTIPMLTAFADAELELDFALSAELAKPGDEIWVTVSLKNYDDTSIADILGIQIDIALETAKVSYVADSATLLADIVVNSDLDKDYCDADIHQSKDKFIFMYICNNNSEIPFSRTNTDLFKFKVKVLEALTDDCVANLTCTQFAVTDENGNRKITVSNSASIQVELERYQITATAGENGNVNGSGEYKMGTLVTLTAVADSGYMFEGWYENNEKVQGAVATYKFAATDNRTLEARFKEFANLRGDVNGDGKVDATDSAILARALATGWETWLSDRGIIVTDFDINGIEITLESGGLSFGDVNGDGKVDATDAAILARALATGWETWLSDRGIIVTDLGINGILIELQ